MRLNFIQILLLLAASQGLFLSVLILHRHRKVYANRFLGSLIFLYSILLVHLIVNDIGPYRSNVTLVVLVVGFSFVMGPLHYLYARYLSHPGQGFRRRDWLHFIPFLVFECLVLCYRPGTVRLLPKGEVMGIPAGFVLLNWIIIAQSAAYMLLTLRVLKRYASAIRNVFSTIEKIKLDWLKKITVTAMAFIAVFLVENTLLLFGIDLSNRFNLTSVLIAVYVYAIGYMGLVKSEVLADPLRRNPVDEAGEDFDLPYEKYGKSGLSEDKAESCRVSLLALMDEKKPYTNPDLTLGGLALMLNISPHNLSEVINTRTGSSFFDFVSRYRVEQVERDLADPVKGQFKLLSIAFDAGFNSKSSFNTVFKKMTGTTPSRYRRKIKIRPVNP
jgi:AraC-like DNA-binding protein